MKSEFKDDNVQRKSSFGKPKTLTTLRSSLPHTSESLVCLEVLSACYPWLLYH